MLLGFANNLSPRDVLFLGARAAARRCWSPARPSSRSLRNISNAGADGLVVSLIPDDGDSRRSRAPTALDAPPSRRCPSPGESRTRPRSAIRNGLSMSRVGSGMLRVDRLHELDDLRRPRLVALEGLERAHPHDRACRRRGTRTRSTAPGPRAPPARGSPRRRPCRPC